MSEFVKKQLVNIWQTTLKLIEDSGQFDPAVFNILFKYYQQFDLV